jgi:glutaminyl-tRNA synthetase
MAHSPNRIDPLITLFKSIGLPESKAAEATKNPKSASVLKDIIDGHGLAERQVGVQEKQAVLLAALAVQVAKSVEIDNDKRDYIIRRILEDKLKSVDQVTGMGFFSLGARLS